MQSDKVLSEARKQLVKTEEAFEAAIEEIKSLQEKIEKTETALIHTQNQLQTNPGQASTASNLQESKPLQKSFNSSRLLRAIHNKDLQQAYYYLRQEIDVNAVDGQGDTALILAIRLREDHPDQARALIEKLCSTCYADVNIRGCKGMTALHRAATRNDLWVTQYLLSKNANPNLLNDFNETPRAVAIKTLKRQINRELHNLLVNAENTQNSNQRFFQPSNTIPTDNIPTTRKVSPT